MNIRTKNIFIERSVCFEEPLQDVELIEEETVEISSRSADDFDDEIGSVNYDILDLIYDISEHNTSGSKSDSNHPTHSQNRPKTYSPPLGQTLEILLIQEELSQIFKEQVFLSLFMIHYCSIPVI